jgi:hypothetical protein
LFKREQKTLFEGGEKVAPLSLSLSLSGRYPHATEEDLVDLSRVALVEEGGREGRGAGIREGRRGKRRRK